MLFKSFPQMDNVLHFILGAVILVCQLLILYRDDAPAFHQPEYPSLLAIVAVVLLLVYHLVVAIRRRPEDSELPKVGRNLLTTIALTGEFLAIGIDRSLPADKQIDSLTLPLIILIGLSLMRFMDCLMDFFKVSEAFSVQCVDENKGAFGMRVVMVHLFILIAAVLQTYKRDQYLSDSDLDSKMATNVQTLDLVVLILLWVHFAIYPANKLIRMTGLDRWAKMCMPPSCFDNQYQSNCEEQDRSRMNGDDLELVAITRVPLVRHVVSGVIIALTAYVTGSVFGKLELTYQLPVLLIYLAADVVGRNYI